jgi:hypothetical protein
LPDGFGPTAQTNDPHTRTHPAGDNPWTAGQSIRLATLLDTIAASPAAG